MNEAGLNLFGEGYDLTTEEGQAFAVRTLTHMREIIKEIQEETGHYYNLEATPAEGAGYRLARQDIARFPDILTAGDKVPYYTNSSQLPVGFTEDIFETLDLQDELQSLYTGGTVLHLYLGEEIKDIEIAKRLIKKSLPNISCPIFLLPPPSLFVMTMDIFPASIIPAPIAAAPPRFGAGL